MGERGGYEDVFLPMYVNLMNLNSLNLKHTLFRICYYKRNWRKATFKKNVEEREVNIGVTWVFIVMFNKQIFITWVWMAMNNNKVIYDKFLRIMWLSRLDLEASYWILSFNHEWYVFTHIIKWNELSTTNSSGIITVAKNNIKN